MKLLLAAPCEKVLDDSTTGQSLIAVFHGVNIKIPTDASVPVDAVIPKEWAIFSKWELEPEEEGKEYMIALEIYWPDGKLFVRQFIPAAVPPKNGLAFIIRMLGFPIGQNGKLRVVNWIQCGTAMVSEANEFNISVSVTRDMHNDLPEGANETRAQDF